MSLTPLHVDGATVGRAEAHPGFADPDYVRRRNLIADRAQGHRAGEPPPRVRYTEAEHAI